MQINSSKTAKFQRQCGRPQSWGVGWGGGGKAHLDAFGQGGPNLCGRHKWMIPYWDSVVLAERF